MTLRHFESEPVIDAVQCMLQWLAQLEFAYLTQALIARTDLPTYASLRHTVVIL